MPHLPASSSEQLKAELIARIPRLRAFAISICGNADRAEDLVQETLVKAWGHLGSFVEGSNLGAWLFTILRNTYFSQYRKRRYEVSDSDGLFVGRLAVTAGQTSHMDLLDLRAALAQLPDDQREAIILIGAAGHSYQDAAMIVGCAVGTIKGRVNRARRRLVEILSVSCGGGLQPAARLNGDHGRVLACSVVVRGLCGPAGLP